MRERSGGIDPERGGRRQGAKSSVVGAVEAGVDRDLELIVGVRRADERALGEFAKRFHPILLDQARRIGVDGDDRRTVVTEFLDDLLVKLAATTSTPRSLTSFVIAAFRNHVTDARRESAARGRHEREQSAGEPWDQVAGAGCSEFMLRSARGRSINEGRPPSEELMRVVLDGCSVEDRQLLVWSSHRVPLRECARWLGIGYDSARQRLSRLRTKLIRGSAARLSELGEEDRAVLVRLLESAGVVVHDDNTRGSAA